MSRRQKDLFPELPDGKRYVSDIPELIAEWHPTKNDGLSPEDVTHGSAKKAWWFCSEGHEWEAAMKLLLISFDSTVKANLSVGLPLDVLAYHKDSFECAYRDRITSEDPYFLSVSNGWGEALKSDFDQLPDFKF